MPYHFNPFGGLPYEPYTPYTPGVSPTPTPPGEPLWTARTPVVPTPTPPGEPLWTEDPLRERIQSIENDYRAKRINWEVALDRLRVFFTDFDRRENPTLVAMQTINAWDPEDTQTFTEDDISAARAPVVPPVVPPTDPAWPGDAGIDPSLGPKTFVPTEPTAAAIDMAKAAAARTEATEALPGGFAFTPPGWPLDPTLNEEVKAKLALGWPEFTDTGVTAGFTAGAPVGPTLDQTLTEDTGIDPSTGFASSEDKARAAALWEYSQSLTGRRDIYEGVMRARPGWGQLNPIAQRGLGRMFDPLSAQYVLEAAQAQAYNETEGVPYVGQDFRGWMGEGQQPWGQEQWGKELTDLRGAFSAFNMPEGVGDPTAQQIALRELYSDRDVQNRLMSAVIGQRVSPFLRRFVPGAIKTRRQQLRERYPARDPFADWVTNPQGSWIQ